MLLKHLLIVATILCFLLFTLGIYKLTKEIEPNLCQMTYMFKNPQYTRIPLKHNIYGLYYYNEGREIPDLRTLSGAPVLFVPGNGGSYKQARSLASVALRMGIGYNKAHLDYFTIDYNEELTALYGGYLARQQRFLKQCINTILRLYKTQDKRYKRKIVIVGHSMGGVMAKSILNESEWLKKIAVIIFISSPLDQPVIYADREIDYFYEQNNRLLNYDKKRIRVAAAAEAEEETSLGFKKNATNVPDVVLISIGGGSRDNLVLTALTESHLSDVHVITTAIPNVWLTCDHLAIMWCLQLMKVVNKFLYELTFKAPEGFAFFSTNALLNLQAAQHYFNGAQSNIAINWDSSTEFPVENWIATKTLSFYTIFENGLQTDYQQAVLYENVAPYEHIYIAVTHEKGNHQWLFGCQHNNCVEEQMLTQQIMQLPSKRGHKTYAILNLAAIFGTFSSWTHLLIRLSATSHYASLYIDVHNAEERLFNLKAPHWFQYMPKHVNLTNSIATTKQLFRKLQISHLTDDFYAFKLKFDFTLDEPKYDNYEAIIRIYAQWAPGFDRYYTLTPAQAVSHDIVIQLPKQDLNATKVLKNSLLFIDIHTDPWCTLSLSYHFSLAHTMRNMVQLHYNWLPAHMALIIIASLGSQFKNSIKDNKYADFLQLKSWYFVVAVRLATSAVTKLPILPTDLLLEHSMKHHISCCTSLITHGFAMAICIAIAFILRLNLHILTKLASLIPLPISTWPKLHIIFAVITACVSMICAKSISLALMFVVYTILVAIANRKQNYQEAFDVDEEDDEFEEVDEKEASSKSDTELITTNDEACAAAPAAKKISPVLTTIRSSPWDRRGFSSQGLSPHGNVKSTATTTKISPNNGFKNMDFHVALMVLILLLIAVNFGDTIAWFKSLFDNSAYHSVQTFQSLLFTPVVFVICFLPLLWHLNTPSFNIESTPIYAVICNTIAAMSLLLCEEKFYRLNYVIAFVVALLVLRELISNRH